MAPLPASTAARTLSLDGGASTNRRLAGEMPNPANAVSDTECVPDPGSRSTQSLSRRRQGVTGSPDRAQSCSGRTTITSWSRATPRLSSAGSSFGAIC